MTENQNQEPDRARIVDLVARDIEARGPIYHALRRQLRREMFLRRDDLQDFPGPGQRPAAQLGD